MGLCVLLSAMHLADTKILDVLNIKSDAVIINQCDKDLTETCEEDPRRVVFLSTRDRGLSKSRNLAVKTAQENGMDDICIFCDNDCVYEEGADKRIEEAFEKDLEADIIVFFIKRPERLRPIRTQAGKLGRISAMKIFSPEIAFRRSSIKAAGLEMDERFGAGAKYGMGEENIFLFDAIKRGLKVKYQPVQIAHLLDTQSTWFKGYTDKFFIDRGAGYKRMAPLLCPLLILQFAIRKYGLYKKDNTFVGALKNMIKGSLEPL